VRRTIHHLLFALALLAIAAAIAQTPHTHQHGFSDAEQWARYFDDPQRDAWQKPHEVITALALPSNAKIADIGAGTGYFTVRLAHMAANGRVYAVDIEPDMVKYLTQRAQHEGLPNIRAILATPSDARLPEKVDRALLVDTYHHIAEREAYFRRLQKDLLPGAEVTIIDFKRDSPIGPPVNERLAQDQVAAEMGRAGYRLVRSRDFLPYQYFLVFAPN
jgi:ubiquinone/menaquinone biosynthesis C-methylase UbiE